MKRILITGVNGFIGNSLKDVIERHFNRYEVFGIDASLRKSSERYFKGDIKDRFFLKTVIKRIRPHYIFHLAGGSVKTEDFPRLVSENVLTTYLLLELLLNVRNFKTRIIIPGSAAEYGQILQKDMPVKEKHALRPVNFYGLSKMYQTLLALSYCKKGLDIIIARIFNIVGWATPSNLSIGRFAYQIALIEKGRKKVTIETKDLNSRRDFVDIQDTCSALMAIAEKGKTGNIYNVCTGRSYKIKYLLDYLLKLSNIGDVKVKTLNSRDLEINSIRGSNKKIARDTDWRPKVNISESLKDTLAYYRGMVE
jgi:GDP-4-dehydro-6-deoxy-D-mannose reductase